MQETLANIADQGTFATQFTAAAIGTGSLTTRLLSFPFSNRKKIDLVLEPEFESLTPFESEDFVFDHATVEAGPEGAHVQAYAVPHLAMQRFSAGCLNSRFDPRIVTATGAALAALPLAVDATVPQPDEDTDEETHDATLHDMPRTAEEAWYRRFAKRAGGDEEEQKITAARTRLEANACTALLYLGENESVLVVLREGNPWLLHASGNAGQALRENSKNVTALGQELRRALLGFEANHGIGPDQLWALGPGAADGALLRSLGKSTGLECEPGRLDREAAGDEAAAMLERHPESALAMGLAYLSARARQIPAPNFRRGAYVFRSRWRELAEPLAAPALLAVVAFVLFLINSLVEFRNFRDQEQVAKAQLEQLYTQARGKAPPEGADPVQVLTTEVAEKRARLEIFRQISGISVLNILAELSRAIKPETPVDFENFRIDNDRVTINGKLDDYAAVDKITGYLSDSKIFTQAEFRDAVPGPDNKIKFRLSLTLVSADSDEEEETPEETIGASAPAPTPAPEPEEIAPFEDDTGEFAPVEGDPSGTDMAGLEQETPPEFEQAAPPPPPEPVQRADAPPPPARDDVPDDMLTPAQRRVREQLKQRQEREERMAERRRERLERANKYEGMTPEERREARRQEQFERIRERKEKAAGRDATQGGNGR